MLLPQAATSAHVPEPPGVLAYLWSWAFEHDSFTTNVGLLITLPDCLRSRCPRIGQCGIYSESVMSQVYYVSRDQTHVIVVSTRIQRRSSLKRLVMKNSFDCHRRFGSNCKRLNHLVSPQMHAIVMPMKKRRTRV